MNKPSVNNKLEASKSILIDNAVTILFVIICIVGIIGSKQSAVYILGEINTRLFRNMILILSLLVPVWAGLGLNFSIVLGAMAAQTGIIVVTNFYMTGWFSLVVAYIISAALSVLLGTLSGKLFNRTKGQEMITGMILGFFAQGIYELIFLYLCGPIIPIQNKSIMLTNDIGLITPINLGESVAGSINGILKLPLSIVIPISLVGYAVIKLLGVLKKWKDYGEDIRIRHMLPVIMSGIAIVLFYVLCMVFPGLKNAFDFTKAPIATGALILLICAVITFLSKTKLGNDINATGQDRFIASTMGINVDKVRIYAVIISTMLAALGQIIYIQDIGNFTTYTAHENVGTYAVAALLVGGASIKKANIGHALLGAVLFHTMFVVVPLAAKNFFGDAATGEYFRVFACYAVIAASLALHTWKSEVIKQQQDKLEALAKEIA